jgi:hypothetical protein
MVKTEEEKASLLAPSNYDDDAPSVGSDGDEQSDGDESVDGLTHDGRSYASDVFDDDYEEEDEDLGADGGKPGVGLKKLFQRGESNTEKKKTIKERRASRRHRERVKRGEVESELVYDMEEGGQASQSPSRHSSESDLRRLGVLQEKKQHVRRCLCYYTVPSLVLTLLNSRKRKMPSNASPCMSAS